MARWIGRAALAALLLLAVAGRTPAADPTQGVRVLYPPDRAVCDKAPTRLVVAAPLAMDGVRATLDGKPLPLRRLTFAETWVLPGKLKATAALVGDRPAAALWCAPLALSPGAHAVAVGGRKLSLRVGDPPAPAGWSASYAHSPVGEAGKPDCWGCHEGYGAGLGAAPTPKACEACHDEASVQLIHRHVAGPLSRCASCHDPHGASRPKLLLDDKPKLCSRCHEAGHSKE